MCLFGFNYRKPPLDDVNFRHALAHLTPKDQIVALYNPTVVKLSTVVPEALALWYNARVDPHSYSPAEAEAILGHAGSLYAKLGGVWRYKTGAPLETVRVFTPLEGSLTYTAGKMFVEECNSIGLTNVKHEPMDFATYLDLVFNHLNFDIYWVCYNVGQFPTHLWSMFHSVNDFPGSSNPHGINYNELDDLLDILWTSLDHDAKVAAVQLVQELVMGGTIDNPLPINVPIGDPRRQAIPIVPVFSRVYYDAMQPDLRGAVNMAGYGVSNMWTYLNIYWNTPYEYRPGTTEKTVVEILEDYPERLNPLWARTEYAQAFTSMVREGLIATNPYTHRDEPWLAESWEYHQVPGGMDVTFNLRLTDSQSQPITWQDGKPITAEDIKFSWGFLANRTIPNYWTVFRFYEGCTIVDADTIVAHMSTTSQWYVYTLASVAYMLSPQVWKQDPRTGATWLDLQTILGFDPSAYEYPLAGNYYPGGYTRIPLPTQLFATGPFINMHSTTAICTQGYGDLQANRNYWLTTAEAQQLIADMFHSAGDVNYDGIIDTADMSQSGLAYNTVPGDELWNPDADVCGPASSPPDDTVNIFDLAMIGKNFGLTRTVPWS